MIKELQKAAIELLNIRSYCGIEGSLAESIENKIDSIISETALSVCDEALHRLLMEQGNNSALRIVNKLKQEIKDNEF